MLNRGYRAISFVLASFALLLLAPSLHAAGTIPLSMTQQLDQFGVPLSGCQLYTIQAGTTSNPQNAYKDTALTITQPNPMVCDSSGRLPQFFLADGLIKIRLQDKLGNPQLTLDNILVIGPSSGGGSGATIDPTTIAATGDLKHAYGTQVIAGWVRSNGRTLGNGASGATERANADTQPLFLYLYATDPNLVVSGGRTTASADYAANKTITLPDARERALVGLGDMGNADAGRLTPGNFGCSVVLLGCAGGVETRALVTLNLPSYTPTGSLAFVVNASVAQGVASGQSPVTVNTGSSVQVVANSSTGVITGTFTGNNNGGTSQAFATTNPSILVTIYIKL